MIGRAGSFGKRLPSGKHEPLRPYRAKMLRVLADRASAGSCGGWQAGETRVRRLMRDYNVLFMRKWKFVVTTDSNHARRVYSDAFPGC